MTPRDKLVQTVAALAALHAAKLTELKAEHVGLEREDFIWHYLLQALSTMGSSRGWHGLIHTPANYARVTYEALLPLSEAERVEQADGAFRDAKMRMPTRKARWTAANVERVRALGGLAAARQALLEAPGAAGKIAFLKQFDGIGEKYGRNIMMDVHHPDFRDTIAIDVRIKNVLAALGITLSEYEHDEQFLLGVAKDAGLSGWELDRILYNFTADVLAGLSGDVPVVGGSNAPVTDAEQELLAAWRKLDPVDQRTVVQVVRSLSRK